MFQESRTEDVVADIKEQLEKLDGQSANLNSLEYHEDSVLISMNDIIDDLYTGMMKFSPEINLEGLKIDVDIDDEEPNNNCTCTSIHKSVTIKNKNNFVKDFCL